MNKLTIEKINKIRNALQDGAVHDMNFFNTLVDGFARKTVEMLLENGEIEKIPQKTRHDPHLYCATAALGKTKLVKKQDAPTSEGVLMLQAIVMSKSAVRQMVAR